MEYLYSDEGQNIWLSGYCNPIRYDDMAAKGTLDAAALAKLPGVQGDRAADTATRSPRPRRRSPTGWPTIVGVTVK